MNGHTECVYANGSVAKNLIVHKTAEIHAENEKKTHFGFKSEKIDFVLVAFLLSFLILGHLSFAHRTSYSFMQIYNIAYALHTTK